MKVRAIILCFTIIIKSHWGFSQYIGGDADGHTMDKNETYVTGCATLPSYTNVWKGGDADGHSMNKNETYVTGCATLPTYTNISLGGNADGHAKDTSACLSINPCSVSAKAAPDTTICRGSTVTLTASGGITYLWDTGDTIPSISVTPQITTTYLVTVSDTSCSNTASVTVTVDTSLLATISGTTSICSGTGTTLTASGGTTYLWDTGDTTAANIVSPTSTTTYTVTVSNGTCSDTTSTTVTVSGSISASVTGSTNICIGDSTTLTASGGTTYSWNTGDTTAAITIIPATDTTYLVTVTNATCTDTVSVTVTVSSPPTASISGTNSICSNDTTVLTASGGFNYLWDTGDTTSVVTVNPTNTTTYFVFVSIGSCTDTASITVTIRPSPTADAGADVTIELGDSTTLTASNGATYSWTPISGLDNPSSSTPIATPTTTTTYYVTVADTNGCSATDSVIVTVNVDCGEPFVPSAFSPNNDGYNDMLLVRIKPNCIKELLFEVYSRWGEKVFETTDQSVGWDGTYKGKEMNTAVFVYYLSVSYIDNTSKIYKGNVTLIK